MENTSSKLHPATLIRDLGLTDGIAIKTRSTEIHRILLVEWRSVDMGTALSGGQRTRASRSVEFGGHRHPVQWRSVMRTGKAGPHQLLGLVGRCG
jgi:hypothetical protein